MLGDETTGKASLCWRVVTTALTGLSGLVVLCLFICKNCGRKIDRRDLEVQVVSLEFAGFPLTGIWSHSSLWRMFNRTEQQNSRQGFERQWLRALGSLHRLKERLFWPMTANTSGVKTRALLTTLFQTLLSTTNASWHDVWTKWLIHEVWSSS